jgi:hypothetical protein
MGYICSSHKVAEVPFLELSSPRLDALDEEKTNNNGFDLKDTKST